ncbi:MAG: DUF4176 domain-containing protein [Eubacteriales bacterium]|nr:DUF4176 domain-containing protein [Eubacteriales bacterium]
MKELLPVGSIVKLTGATKKAAIMGYFQKISSDGSRDVYDYMAVPYPEGFLGKGSVFLFNEEDIGEVCFRGYESNESRGYSELIGMIFEEARKGTAGRTGL